MKIAHSPLMDSFEAAEVAYKKLLTERSTLLLSIQELQQTTGEKDDEHIRSDE